MYEFWRSTIGKSSKAREKLLTVSRGGDGGSPRKGEGGLAAADGDELTALSGGSLPPTTGGRRESSTTTRCSDRKGSIIGRLSAQPSQQTIHFRDLKLTMDPEAEVEEETQVLNEESACPSGHTTARLKRKLIEKHKLILIMVGLPGRGKTFLCNKLKCYLNWLGHETRHFNVGMYRRQEKHEGEMQDANFFDHTNKEGMEARQRALVHALDDMIGWLNNENAQIAIFDATNTTKERREYLIKRFHGNFSYMFIESVCNDQEVLEQNYRLKMKYSPDYQDVNQDQALQDFKDRIRKYEAVYEPISDRNLHYIKLIDMVTGRGHMDVNRISGYIPGKIVFFLMQVCKSGLCRPRRIWLTRHGESVYNTKGLIGGDSDLSPLGEAYSFCLADAIVDRVPIDSDGSLLPVSAWTSTLKRTIQTADPLPFPKLRWKVLDEINAGDCDGMTYEEISQKRPEEYEARKKDKLRYRYPRGESYMDVIQRLEPCIIEVERERECVVIVAHQAVLRALYGYFKAIPLKDIPTLDIPLHTIIELTPRPDGTMMEERFPLTVNVAERSNRGIKSRDPSHQTLFGSHLPISPVPEEGRPSEGNEGGSPLHHPVTILGSSPMGGSLGGLNPLGPGRTGSNPNSSNAQLQGATSHGRKSSRGAPVELSGPVDGASMSMLTPVSYQLYKGSGNNSENTSASP